MRIAADTGGTFTDLVLEHGGRVLTYKLLSSPDDPARAVLEGIRRLLEAAGGDDRPLSLVVHGSTVATNALLERKGARVALVTTAGFEDVLEIGRQARPKLHSLEVRRPAPLVPAERRLGAKERLAADGRPVLPLSSSEVERTTSRLASLRPESVALVLLHSYANPEHEARLAGAIERRIGVPVTSSHDLLPEYREYERTSTCVVNAYVAPVMAKYLSRLRSSIADLPGAPSLRVMRSDGGTMSADAAAEKAVHTVLSGPAGGVVGGAAAACSLSSSVRDPRIPGESSDRGAPLGVITFDMGGTSTDVCLVKGRPGVTREARVGEHPVRVPLLDIHTVGAGGGSIAWKDAGGALRVGPGSAGSKPGPACYGLGGVEATVTDANVVLGRLPVSVRLAGSLALDPRAARAAVAELAASLQLEVEDCARGILRVANTVMMRAIGRISLERGHDPRRFTLVGFGGAGGLHACDLALTLSMKRVLVPPSPGLLSAWGMLAARPQRELARSVLVTCRAGAHGPEGAGAERIETAFGDMEKELCEGMIAEGLGRGDLELERMADLRYVGQSYELTVRPASPGKGPAAREAACSAASSMPDRSELSRTVAAFHQAHEQAFGYRMDRDVEIVTTRVRALGPPRGAPPSGAPAGSAVEVGPGAHARDELPAGSLVLGPASVFEYSSTTYVPGGWRALVLQDGALLLHQGEGSRA